MNFDEIIKQKLEGLEGPFDAKAWSKLHAQLSANKVNFQIPFISGIAASVILGSILFTMPNKGANTDYRIEAELVSNQLISTHHNETVSEVVFEPQEVHVIALNNLEIEDTKKLPPVSSSNNQTESSASTIELRSNNEEASTSTLKSQGVHQIDFIAKGIQCIGTEIQFSASLSEKASVVWLFESVHVQEGLQATHAFNLPGEHKVRMVVSFEDGSEQALTKTIDVFETPRSTFSIEKDELGLCYFNETTLIGSPNGNTYKWLLDGDTIGIGSELSLLLKPGLHTIGMLTINQARCASFESNAVRIEEGLKLYGPSAFNASDANGRNDEWTIVGLDDLQSYKLDIIRLSTNQIVYSATENAKWNGSISGTAERPLKGEAFVWILKGVDQCGNQFETKSDKPFTYL